jgi:hypothetical protein
MSERDGVGWVDNWDMSVGALSQGEAVSPEDGLLTGASDLNMPTLFGDYYVVVTTSDRSYLRIVRPYRAWGSPSMQWPFNPPINLRAGETVMTQLYPFDYRGEV